MKKTLSLLLLLPCGLLQAEEQTLELMLGAKAGTYQTSGNLFADRDLQGWGLTLKLIPDSFGKPAHDNAWTEGFGWMLSLDIDNMSGRSQNHAQFPFSTQEYIQMAWTVFAFYACAFTERSFQLCLGLPFSNSLYLEQNLGGQSYNSFTMGNRNPPLLLNLISAHKPLNFGVQWSTSYWNPTFAGVETHFNLIQAQVFAGYIF